MKQHHFVCNLFKIKKLHKIYVAFLLIMGLFSYCFNKTVDCFSALSFKVRIYFPVLNVLTSKVV